MVPPMMAPSLTDAFEPARQPNPPRRLWPRNLAILLVLASVACPATLAFGHGRSVSYSAWEFTENTAVVTVRMKLLELSRHGPEALPPGSVQGLSGLDQPDRPAGFLPRDLILTADGQACPPESIAERRADEPGWARYRWRINCPADATVLAIRSRILLDVAPSHLHFARVRQADEEDRIRERVLTEESPVFEIQNAAAEIDSTKGPNPGSASRFADYLELGVRHILSGWDHLAFIFGLLLLARRLREVAQLITGFTIAHSLTLGLAVQGLVEPRAAAVEAVIAFSVALVAIEKGWIEDGKRAVLPIAVVLGLLLLGIAAALGIASLSLLTIAGLILFTGCYFELARRNGSAWLRVLLTFAFGLVHGFGFAGILVEMTLPTDRLVPALLGFNLGVELGQIGIVLIVWPLLTLGMRAVSNQTTRYASAFSTACLCGLGLYWLLTRVALP